MKIIKQIQEEREMEMLLEAHLFRVTFLGFCIVATFLSLIFAPSSFDTRISQVTFIIHRLTRWGKWQNRPKHTESASSMSRAIRDELDHDIPEPAIRRPYYKLLGNASRSARVSFQ